MRIETTYFAFDDTEFDTEEECIAYETEQNALWDSVVLLDEEFHGPKPGIGMLEFAVGFAIYVKVIDVEKYGKLFNWVYEYSGTSMPPVDTIYTGGVFKYDESVRENWIDLTERLREITMEMAEIEKVVSGK